MIPMPRFPPRGPLGRLFPRFLGTIKALRLPASIPPHFVSFAWRYHGNASLSLSSPRRMVDDEPGVFHPVTPTGNVSVETTGSPKFLGNPNSRLLMFFDPGRPNVPNLSGTLAWSSLEKRRRRQRHTKFSRLNSMAFGLAVYVSRCRLPFTAQDSLPGAGQALLGGLPPARLH